jgi:hypothetical protein
MTSKKPPKLQETKPAREGVIRCTSEVRGKQVRSIYVSGADEFNVVNIDFSDGTALTVQIIPVAKLKVELNDWTSGDGRLLKKWPVIITC